MDFGKFLLQDQYRIRSLLRKIEQFKKSDRPFDKLEGSLEKLIASAIDKVNKRHNALLSIKYPSELPISSKIEEIKSLICSNQVVIVSGSTGSGKTTQLPKILFECGFGKVGRIGCTQPRRLAASGMAKRVSEETKCVFGKEIGCKVRFSDNTSDNTVIKFMTDGILLSETISDRLLLQYDSIIIDEAHERTLNIDFIIGYIKNILPQRPNFKLIISSATLNTQAFSDFFDKSPVIQIEGKMFPIEDVFIPPYEDEDTSFHIQRGIEWINEMEDKGDILVFLPGEKEIKDSFDLLEGQKYLNTEIIPLYGRMSINEQQRIFQPGKLRRIILSTNVAETSITIPGIKYVVDSGLVRINRYDPRYRIESLQIENISRASEKQRRGRCGRLKDGICIHLYDKSTLESSPEFTDPEICRSSLAEVILQMISLNLPEIDNFPFLEKPKNSLIREGYKTLYDIQAIDNHNKLTEEGKIISDFPIDPCLAKMVCQGNKEKSLNEMIIIASFLSLQDPRERSLEKQTVADNAHKRFFDERSDFISILKLWNFLESEGYSSTNKLRKICKENFLNYRRIKEWRNLYLEIIEAVEEHGWEVNTENIRKEIYDYASIHSSIISAFPANVGIKTEKGVYQGAGEIKFFLFPGSNIFKTLPKWVVCSSIVETSKLYARIGAEISPEWIENAVSHLCKSLYKDIYWEKKRGFVSALETVVFRGLLINEGRRIHYGRVNSLEARKIFIRDALAPGNFFSWHKWLKDHKKMIEDIKKMEIKIRRPESLLNNDAIFEHFDKIIPDDVCSVKSFEEYLNISRPELGIKFEDAMYFLPGDMDFIDYPDELIFANCSFALQYSFNPGEIDDGVTLLAKTSELNLLPSYICDWLVPGYLSEKVRFLIKSLPKNKRILCNPIQKTAEEFTNEVKAGRIRKNSKLLTSLSIFLSSKLHIEVMPDDFNESEIPKYLIMKVGEIKEGQSKLVLTEGFPDLEDVSTRIQRLEKNENMEQIPKNFMEFPSVKMEEKVLIDKERNIYAYPALIIEGNGEISIHLFTDQREAQFNHRMALVKLFSNKYKEQTKYLEKQLPIKTFIAIELSSIYGSSQYKSDFSGAVIFHSLTDKGNIDIRDICTFNDRAEKACSILYQNSIKFSSILENIINERNSILSKLGKKFQKNESYDDICRQMEFLFQQDFLKRDYVWTRYSSYLKALSLRIERLNNSPLKDLNKFSEIKPYQEKFDERIKSLKNSQFAFGVMEFAKLLQEFRIKVFAPEISLPEKISSTIMDQKIKEIMLN
ncbi:MAG TPA: ATP-dependent RNA helicase HrpA [Lentisphaeria bacterium]|nr:MAG: ATP-dependent RNA helicase HrpA [Lentisphaerae bacterium GWF2_38_69]HBM15493.1 ATP-dependent RNA helicase HrpA [Lentisphaeria bacterium]